MKMKFKTSTILIVVLIMLTPFYESANANVDAEITITQSPWKENVRAGDIVTITADIKVPNRDWYNIIDTLFSETEVRWEKNGIRQINIKCNEVLPAQLKKVTFTLGPFQTGDLLRFSVWIGINNYVNDYSSSIMFFTVLSADVPTTFEGLPSWALYTIIGVGVLALLVALYFFRRSKKN